MDDELKQTSGTDDDNRKLPTPHFDDEATLLSARPVVPFHQLAAKNPRRRLYFGAGLVIALLIGLFGGIFYVHLNERPDAQRETGTTATQEELLSTTEAHAESPASPAESTEEVGLPAKTTTVTATKVPEIPRPRRNPARITEKTASRPARGPRTEAPRRAQTSDDMFRIHEIFEGSSRP